MAKEVHITEMALHVTDMPDAQSGQAVRTRAEIYAKKWLEMIARGEKPKAVITDPSKVTVEDAIEGKQ